MTPEGDIQAAIMRVLSLHPSVAMHWRQNTGRRGGVSYGIKGHSDIMGIMKGGRFLAIEVKTAKGIVTPEQEAFLQAVKDAGGLAMVARSHEDVIDFLELANK